MFVARPENFAMNLKNENLERWLSDSCRLDSYRLTPLAGDASFRRYFRVQLETISYIAMDASSERASCLPFVSIASALGERGILVPEVYFFDEENGFLLLMDFGDDLLLKKLTENNAEKYYSQALDSLALMQACREIKNWTLPFFTADFMVQELNLFKEWFLQKHLELNLSSHSEKDLENCFRFLAESAAAQPQVFMYRDFHSANVMVLPDERLGFLDFQDAFIGPVTYDLVSLLRDCYIAWPEKIITKLALEFRERLALKVSAEEFLRWFDLMGLQRHLKALLTFSRKYHRDGNSNYLQHVPRTLNYILTVGERYSECEPLLNCLRQFKF